MQLGLRENQWFTFALRGGVFGSVEAGERMFALMLWGLEVMFAKFGAGWKKKGATRVEIAKVSWFSEHL